MSTNTRPTVASTYTLAMNTAGEVASLKGEVADLRASMDSGFADLKALLLGNTPQAPAVEAPVAEPKADAKPAKAYRSAAGKERAKAQCKALAVKWDLKVAGGTRTFKSLSATEQAAYRAEEKAIWAAVPKTRTTKA